MVRDLREAYGGTSFTDLIRLLIADEWRRWQIQPFCSECDQSLSFDAGDVALQEPGLWLCDGCGAEYPQIPEPQMLAPERAAKQNPHLEVPE